MNQLMTNERLNHLTTIIRRASSIQEKFDDELSRDAPYFITVLAGLVVELATILRTQVNG